MLAGSQATPRRVIEAVDAEQWGDRYLPGRVIQRKPLGFSVPILFLANLADPAFWEQHCFVARGIETLNGDRVVRMDFSPTLGLTSADWEGAAFVDSATSLLRRVEFRLTGMKSDERPQRLEGYTVFTSPSPSSWFRTRP